MKVGVSESRRLSAREAAKPRVTAQRAITEMRKKVQAK